jgi:AraC family transcriptional regulator of adaptative response/methylated-DNA-[protein]-cysteine methyltransferase
MIQPGDAAPEPLDESACWQAVLNRDERGDGIFVYGVSSTLIFCRPSCPSRRPQRERARFFSSIEEAMEAGFRPCKRCRPETVSQCQVAACSTRPACRPLTLTRTPTPDKDGYHGTNSAQIVGGQPIHSLKRTFSSP